MDDVNICEAAKRALAQCLARPLPADRAAAARYLYQHDLSAVVARAIADNRSIPGGILKQAGNEYRKYMSLSLFDDGDHPMFSAEVDAIWHAHLLFTHDYMQFCHQVFGRFIHHQPVSGDSGEDGNENPVADWNEFTRVYSSVYGAPHYLWGSGPTARGDVVEPLAAIS